MNRFLIIKIGAMGDIFFALPALAALKSTYPTSEITWVVGEKLVVLLSGHPLLDKIVTVNEDYLFSRKTLVRLKEGVKLRKRLNQKYDQIFIFHRALSYALILQGKGKIYQISTPPLFPSLFSKEIPISPFSMHESLSFKKLIQTALKKKSLVWSGNLNYLRSKTPFKLPEDFIIIHCGGGKNFKTEFKLKKWPYSEKLITLILEQTDLFVVLIGTPEEMFKSRYLEKNNRVINLIGKTTLQQLVALIHQCQVFIGPDSGPLHIADFLNKPCIGIFGPTSPVSWGLLSAKGRIICSFPECAPCYKDDGNFPICPNDHICMTHISAQTVFVEVQKIING